MWKCDNCQEEIETKFKHCWNCGNPRPANVEPPVRYKKIVEAPKVETPSTPMVKVEPIVEEKVEVPPKIEESKPKIVIAEDKKETEPKVQEEFFSNYKIEVQETPPSILWTAIPVLFWLIAAGATAYFAYISNQKTTSFDKQILADGQNLNAQKTNFSFPTTALPDRKNQYKIEGNFKGKVLPLNKANGEVTELLYSLPDDLRPTNSDEVKTVFWLECKPEEIGKGKSGAVRSRENCNTYLVDRETAKFIGVQEFLGVPPALTNDRDNLEAVGKVLPEKYIAYLREKQAEAERGTMKLATDSPNHHFFSQSEFYLAIGLLCVLGAIGIGWLVFKIKSLFISN